MKVLLSDPSRKQQFLLLLVDSTIVLGAFVLSYSLRMYIEGRGDVFWVAGRIGWLVWATVLLHLISLYVFELYDLKRKPDGKLLISVILSVAVAAGMSVILNYVQFQNKLGRVVLTGHMPLTVIGLFVWRKLFFAFFRQGRDTNNLLLIGNSPLNQEILKVVNESSVQYYKPVNTIYEYKENPGTIHINGHVSAQSLSGLASEQNIRTIVISQSLTDCPLLKGELVNMKFGGLSIYDAPVFYEKMTGKVPVAYVRDAWFLFHRQLEIFGASYWKNVKRITDIFFAAALLLLSAPIFLLACIAIKMTSKGPVIFSQERLGLNERPFTLMKLRTMVNDAEKDVGPVWSSREDPRITIVGKILRKTRIDEIPQLINILKGEMSFVGPRPIRKHFADLLAAEIPFYRLRFLVKPGVTGWAQVRHDYAGSEEGQREKLEYDLFYIRNQSLFFDILVVLKTIQTILFRPGE